MAAGKLTLDKFAMRDKATAHLRIYVGNLTDNCTVDEIYDCFSPHGQVNGIVVNRGFGFVQFQDESSVQTAIQKSDGIVLNGKTLNIRPAVTNTTKPAEVVVVRPEVPPAVSLASKDSYETFNDETVYDKHGNFIGDEDEVGDDFPDSTFKGSHPKVDTRGRGGPIRGRGRGRGEMRGRGGRGAIAGFRDRSPHRADWSDKGYERFQTTARKLPVPERNDCEIIVVSRNLTEYAEYIESRLHQLGIVVDLLYPMEDVPIGKVLGNIASRGCLYAILVMPSNQEHRSLTLTMLHGLPQEHRNMPIEDAFKLIARNFEDVRRGGGTGREAVYALLGQLADGQTLTALQYDKVIEYLQERKEHQIKVELGEPLSTSASKTQTELQQRILSILNEKKVETPVQPSPPPPAKEPLLNDPTVRKALDSILQKFI